MHELLNEGVVKDIIKRLFDQVVFSNMRVSAPNIISTIDCLQKQPEQINILEKYIDWI